MALATDIQDACLILPELDRADRGALIERILDRLESLQATILQTVPPEKRYWIDTLIASVRYSVDEIASMETDDLLSILVEFEKLIVLLDGIAESPTQSLTLH